MSITETITADIKQAMRDKNKVALTAMRALKTAITNAEKDTGSTLSDTEVITIIRKQVKQRLDSITQYEDAGRAELAETEKAEISILEKYLPHPLTEEEINTIVTQVVADVQASSMADMGKVMKAAQEKCQGRADGKTLSLAVKNALSQ